MSSLDPYAAAHASAVMFDRASQGTIVLTGGDRRSFLHALLTNDIARLTEGTGTYAAYLTPQGRMIADMRVIETGGSVLLGVERDVAGPLAARLDTLIFSEDVQVRDASDAIDVVGVHGPSAPDIIQRACGVRVADLSDQYDNRTANAVTVVRDDALGLPGFDLYAPKAEADALRVRLERARVVKAGDDTYELLRIEAGRPRFGVDMTTDTIPLEAGLDDRAISLTKGCYVGQEVIVRVLHRGHGRVARRLVSIAVSNAQVPARGDKVLAGDRPVGEITSAAASPRIGSPLALGYVQRDYAVPGTELTVNGSEARVLQTVN
jgi:folate-binding protein YgfZ